MRPRGRSPGGCAWAAPRCLLWSQVAARHSQHSAVELAQNPSTRWLVVGSTAPLPGMISAAAMSLTASSKLGSRTLWWSGLAPPYCARGCSLALAMPGVLHRGTVRASTARCTSVAVAKVKVHVVGFHLTLSAMNTSSIVRKRPGSVQPRRTRRLAARRSFLRIVFSASRARATHH